MKISTPSFSSNSNNSSLLVSLFMLILLGSLWGAMTALAKVIGLSGVPALGYAFWQTFGAGIILLVICILQGQTPPINLSSSRHYITVAVIGSAIPTTNLFYVLTHLPAGIVAIVITTVPIFTYLISIAAKVEHFDWQRSAGISFGFAGALLILLPKESLPDPTLIPIVLLAFISPLFYSLNSVYAIKYAPKNISPMHTATGMMLGSSFILFPICLAFDSFFPLWKNIDVTTGLLILHMVLAASTFLMYFVLLKRTGPVYFSQVAFVVTINAVVWGIFLFDEQHSKWIWIALVLIFVGVALVNLRQKQITTSNTEN